MITQADTEAGEFWKIAEDAHDEARLEQEAKVLAVACHPGVVHLLGGDRHRLRFRLAPAVPLAGWVGSDEEFALVAVDASRTLADLHDLGVVHGSLHGDHVLVDDTGHAVLCGFGGGALAEEPTGPAARADVEELAGTLLGAYGGAARGSAPGAARGPAQGPAPGPRQGPAQGAARGPAQGPAPGPRQGPGPGPLADTLARAAGGFGPLGARRFAEALVTAAMAAAAGSAGTHRRAGTARLRSSAAVIVAGIAAVATMAVLARARGQGHRPHPPQATRPQAVCPPVDDGCGPLAVDGGTIAGPAGRYQIGGPGQVIVVGRFLCGEALPALLDPGSGQVWLWPVWARRGAGPVAARGAGQVADSSSIRVAPGPANCDSLEVLRHHGPAVVIRPADTA